MNLIKKRLWLGKFLKINLIANFILRWISILTTFSPICSYRSICSDFLLRRADPDHRLAINIHVETLIFCRKRIIILNCHVHFMIFCSDRHKVILVVLECFVRRLFIWTKALSLLNNQLVRFWRRQRVLYGNDLWFLISKNSLFTEVEARKNKLQKLSDFLRLETEFLKILFKFEFMEINSFKFKCFCKNVNWGSL